MKKIAFLLCLFVTTTAFAQVDSSKIPQSIALPTLQHIYILGMIGDWGNVDVINHIVAVRQQLDTANMSKAITVTVPSEYIKNVFYIMSQQREGEATQYNESIAISLLPQITNPWLGAQLYKIQGSNWASRDSKILATKLKLLQIIK